MLPIVAVTYVAVGIVLVAVAIPLLRRRIGPNPLYGLRTRATADPRVWYDANAAHGRDLLILGIVQILSASVPLLFTDVVPPGAYMLGNIAVCIVGVIVVAIVGLVRAERILAKKLNDNSHTVPKASPPMVESSHGSDARL